uniref:SH2 domain-containing protein n=1 Tax=Sinocyclocheilus anshuiensis TaxID=1608454 RepID=A0A671K4J2_9TELE
MARWFKEHLGFKTTKAPPPAPPKPDYRHFHTAVSSLQTPLGTGLLSAQPDILTAYKLQKELDFEDPYTPGGTVPFSTGPSSAAEVKYASPKHRLIKVEAVRPPCSPPADPENGTQEKVRALTSAGRDQIGWNDVKQTNKQTMGHRSITPSTYICVILGFIYL